MWYFEKLYCKIEKENFYYKQEIQWIDAIAIIVAFFFTIYIYIYSIQKLVTPMRFAIVCNFHKERKWESSSSSFFFFFLTTYL